MERFAARAEAIAVQQVSQRAFPTAAAPVAPRAMPDGVHRASGAQHRSDLRFGEAGIAEGVRQVKEEHGVLAARACSIAPLSCKLG